MRWHLFHADEQATHAADLLWICEWCCVHYASMRIFCSTADDSKMFRMKFSLEWFANVFALEFTYMTSVHMRACAYESVIFGTAKQRLILH